MNLTNRIRVALITFAIFATILSLVSLATYFVKSENEAVKCLQEQNELKLKHLVTFSHFCDADTHPRFLLTVSALNLLYFICLLVNLSHIGACLRSAAVSLMVLVDSASYRIHRKREPKGVGFVSIQSNSDRLDGFRPAIYRWSNAGVRIDETI
jgi:hypothetical protein